ncbi:MAG: metallophosphoesterase [Bacteroidota bacterium]
MKVRLISIVSIWFLFTTVSLGQPGPMLMPPYLQAVATSSIYVLVESSSPDTVTVEYGPTSAYGLSARTESIESTTNSTYVHNVKLTGLAPNSEYHYRALQAGTASADASFRTAVLPGTSFRFAWMADCRTGTAIHDSIAKRIAEANPLMSLYGGDLCFNSSYFAFKNEYFRPNELALIARVPFFNAPGNHEGWSDNTKAFTQAPASASGTQEYYSIDYGDLHVLVLNTELPYDEGSPQYIFAQNDLSSTTRAWKIVTAHKHAYCSGGHGENSDLKTMTTKIFEPNRVDMFISGHSHFYQHNVVNGIHHMIIGTAGAPLYSPSNVSYTVKSVKDYNYAIVDLSPISLRMMVYNDRGILLDSLVLNKPTNVKSTKPGAPEGYHMMQGDPRQFDYSAFIHYLETREPAFMR